MSSETSPLESDAVSARPGQPADNVTAPLASSTPGGEAAAPLHLDLRPGSRPVPEYELTEKLGEGGFGQVWRARDSEGYEVALKFLRLDERTGATEQRSLDVMKNIRHPHLLTMFRIWRMGTHLIIAMELGDTTLYQRLFDYENQGKTGVPRKELLEYMREIAKGLDHLHSVGVQHRDIKPQNFLLCGGSVKVADFGLAKVVEAGMASNSGAMTPAYAAPEFFQGRTEPNSDQYSLAVTYCQLRGGKLPFSGSPTEMLFGHMQGEPDLSMLAEAEKPVVARALAKRSVDRWPSCRAFIEALSHAAEDTVLVDEVPSVRLQAEAPPTLPPPTIVPAAVPTAPAPQSRPRLSWAASIGLGLALGVVVALAAVNLWPPRVKDLEDVQSVDKSTTTEPPVNLPPQTTLPAKTPTPPRNLTPLPIPTVKLTVGKSISFPLTVEREELSDPISVEIADLPRGVEVLGKPQIARGKKDTTIELTARADAPTGVAEALVRLQAGDVKASEKLALKIEPAERPRELVNSLDMKLILLPPGEFAMGSPDTEEGSKDDEHVHAVKLRKSYYLGQHAVTRGQFRAFVEAAGYQPEAIRDGKGCWGYDPRSLTFVGPRPNFTWQLVGFDQDETHPVVNVTWNDARAFCEWLSKKEGQLYRLPTEAEWEYACRAGTTTPFSNGSDSLQIVKVGNVADAALRGKLKGAPTLAADDGFAFTSPVGTLAANPWGLHDLHGNVWEWCNDWYDVDYYAKSPADDPPGPQTGTERVLRGGSWMNIPSFCRSACRAKSPPSYRHPTIGFRVAVPIE